MSEYMFLCGDGHLPERAAEIAQRLGAQLVNYTEPNGYKRHWFVIDSTCAALDQSKAEQVQRYLERAGVL